MFPNFVPLFCLVLYVATGCVGVQDRAREKARSAAMNSISGASLSVSANDSRYPGVVYYVNDKLSAAVLTLPGHEMPGVGYGFKSSDEPASAMGVILDLQEYREIKTYEDYENSSIRLDNYYVYIVSKGEILDKIAYETLGLKKNYDTSESCCEDMESKIGAYLEKHNPSAP